MAAEIDRVSDTTQFNSINVLDGSYNSKVFQIGSNENQTMNISIGSMHSSVLGVATSNSAAASMAERDTSSSGVTGAGAVEGAVAQGTAPTETVVNLEFLNNSGSDGYSFTIVDGITGLTAQVTNLTVDMTSQVSKDAFAASLNLSAASGQTDSTVTSSISNFSSEIGGTLDLTNTSNYGKVKFAISVDGGATVQIDLRDKLVSTNGVTDTAVTETQILTALDAELERLFDARVGAASSSGALAITDQEGRRIKVTQGAGDGTMFGTDEAIMADFLHVKQCVTTLVLHGKATSLSLPILGAERLLCLVFQLRQIARYYLMWSMMLRLMDLMSQFCLQQLMGICKHRLLPSSQVGQKQAL